MNRIVVETGGTDWLTPLATLLAVLVGGIVSWFVESRLAGRRAQFEREEEAKPDPAARLVERHPLDRTRTSHLARLELALTS
jgi:hypothetical protein